MLPRDTLLNRVENREAIARVLDLGEQALRTWDIAVTDFLSPPVLAEAIATIAQLTELTAFPWGGYPQAERQRLAIARVDLPLSAELVPLAVVEIAGNFLFDPASHRDFLGAILGTGLDRDKVGDVLVLGERGGQALIVPELVDFLRLHLTQVRTVPVKVQAIVPEELKVKPPSKKELATVEASLRLDAIASAGFGMSRSKMAEAIGSGDVRVNWKEITQASHQLKAGDLITYRGKGRLEVGEVVITKKQRYRIQLTRYS